MKQRVLVALGGIVVVAAYAALMALQALVLDPLAAVPGSSLAAIHAHLLADGMDVRGDLTGVLASAGVGVALAVGVAVLGIRLRVPALTMAMLFLALVAGGAVVTFGSGFALGMDVADSYGVGGGDHTIWAGCLYLTSLAALVALGVLGAAAVIRARSRVSQPA